MRLPAAILLACCVLPAQDAAVDSRGRTREPAEPAIQAQAPDADESSTPIAEFQIRMLVERSDSLTVRIEHDQQGRAMFAILLASFDGGMVQLQGLPPILDNPLVVATALVQQGATFDLGPVAIDVFLQGGALSGGVVVATDPTFVPAPRISGPN